jgi:hypothetical protein
MSSKVVVRKRPSVGERLDQLGEMSRSELADLWIKQFKCAPPKGVKRGLLERAAGYQLQLKRYGGLKPEVRRALRAVVIGIDDVPIIKPSPPELKPGSRLVREWHGKSHQVNVTNAGFEWDGDNYTSLSAIALAITGTKWSGPRFFGVR